MLEYRGEETYKKFWAWSDAAVDTAMITGKLVAALGWPIHIGAESNPRSLMNFPMQANGAEILRLACSEVTEAGIEVCAPVHDALLICAPLEDFDHAVERTQRIMTDAAATVLDGFHIGTDADLIRWPGRYSDGRGAEMWNTTMALLDRLSPTAEPSRKCEPTFAPVRTNLRADANPVPLIKSLINV
jgi:DNA polymerase I